MSSAEAIAREARGRLVWPVRAQRATTGEASERATGSASAAERRGNPPDSLPLSVAEAALGETNSSRVPDGYAPIDYSGLARIRAIDAVSAVVWAEAGATWGEVEQALAPRALTLGPVPAWLWDRMIVDSLAQDDRLRPSPRFGQLTDSLLSMRAALPDGALTHAPTTPRRATGPDLPRCVIGAHHRAGLVVDVHIQAWPRPVVERRVQAFAGFAEALDGAVALLRAGVRPVWWQAARGRGDVRLLVEVVAGEAGGWGTVAPGDTSEPTEIRAVFTGARAEAAAYAQAHPGTRICDIRPEGATVFAARGAPEPAADWADLAAQVFEQVRR